MKNSKKVGISIGIGIGVVIISLMVFTNVGDMVSNTVSQVEIGNPLQTYHINTKEEYVCAMKDTSQFVKIFNEMKKSPEVFAQKYPKEINELNEYAESGQLELDFASTGGKTPQRLIEIVLPVYMTELSINPSLKGWLLDIFDNKISQSEIRDLENTLCPDT